MTNQRPVFPARLFYSYCHKDAQHRASMEKSLALLKQEGLLEDWSDQSILPGESISKRVREEMDKADIMVFLLSQDFIASEECMKEWDYGKQLAKDKLVFRIPIILENCPWKDLLDSDDIKALPKDGKPVAGFTRAAVAWQEVYEGIKAVIDQLRKSFTPKPYFIKEIEKTDFLSQQYIKLQDIFIFPRLSCYTPQTKDGKMQEEAISDQKQLLDKNYILVHGEEMSGKTALGRYLFLSLVQSSEPALYVDLEQMSGNSEEKILRDTYHSQFNGDYDLWRQQQNKTLILDNLSSMPRLLNFVVYAKNIFGRIIVTLSSDIFNAFLKDEERIADFSIMTIEPLTHNQQEKLIRKRLELSDRDEPITDGYVDQVEDRINSAIISNRIVPRYPFYVLSILQTYEGYMPGNLSITSYGHCYYVLILANLIKAGISRSDTDINICLNFAEKLAFKIHQDTDEFDFDQFVNEYREKFLIPESILNRLKHHEYGIITANGRFRTKYTYYFFLGKCLATNTKEHRNIIEQMCEESHLASNHLTLLFIIHHTNDNQIIDDILLRTMCTLDNVYPAALDHEETKKYRDIIAALPKSILSNDAVTTEREKERDLQDTHKPADPEDKAERIEEEDPANDCYRILKNNEILGQVLRNKYGSLEKTKIEEIVETIADGGLRLVNIFLKDEKEIADWARYIQRKFPQDDTNKIKNILRTVSFLWTMTNVEKIVYAINHPGISKVVDGVVRQQSTPAYDLIGYFSQLDSAKGLTEEVKQRLEELLKKHRDRFLKEVLSLRTQHYMNTHRGKVQIEQSVCSLLDIKYVQRHRY